MTRSTGPARYYLPAALAALVTCAVVIVIHLESLSTLLSAHGLLHTAIAERFGGSWSSFGQPENPFFAGERLPYYWFYHYAAARLSAATGLHPLRAFEILGLLGASLVWLSGVALGRRLGWRPGPSVAIGFMAFAGANALGSLGLLAKLASGRPWPVDDGAYLWGLAHPVLGLVRFNDPGALYGPLINFFLNNSSRGLSLSLVMVGVLALFRYLEAGRVSALMSLTGASAACTAFSPIIGLVSAGAISAALAGDWLWRATRSIEEAEWGLTRFALAAGALLIGCGAAMPTYYHLLSSQTAQPGNGFEFRPDLAVTILVSIGPMLVLALVAFLRLPDQRRFLGLLIGAGAVLILGNAALKLPAGNECNLFHVAVFLFAIPAAGAFRVIGSSRPPARMVVSVALLCLFVSTPLVVVWAYWRRPQIPLVLAGSQLRVTPPGSSDARLYEWVADGTPSASVFVADPSALGRPPVGNTPGFPALTGRFLFVADQPDYIVDPYVDTLRRRQITQTLTAGNILGSADREYLLALHRPIFLIVRNASDERLTALNGAYGKPAFRDQHAVVFQLYGQ